MRRTGGSGADQMRGHLSRGTLAFGNPRRGRRLLFPKFLNFSFLANFSVSPARRDISDSASGVEAREKWRVYNERGVENSIGRGGTAFARFLRTAARHDASFAEMHRDISVRKGQCTVVKRERPTTYRSRLPCKTLGRLIKYEGGPSDALLRWRRSCTVECIHVGRRAASIIT